jgi:NTP pyrophosphatase (non-canonical NTP hydrolase)
MRLQDYQQLAKETAVFPKGNEKSYVALGLAEEAGEVAGVVKRLMREDAISEEELRNKLVKEMGDVLWYLAAVGWVFGVTLEEVARTNLAKLDDRAKRGVLKGSGDDR